MAPHYDSAVESNQACEAVPGEKQNEAARSSYTSDQLLSLRPGDFIANSVFEVPSPTSTTEVIESADNVAIPGDSVQTDVKEDELTPRVTSDCLDPDGFHKQDFGRKKKKKKKSNGKNKKPNPTGFEEFYADPPITPSEHAEEFYDIYHHERSFIERIEQCIQRYRSRRKLDAVRANVFDKYLTLGGIDSTIKAFTGELDQETIENSTAAEIAAMQAQDFIRGGNPKFYDPNKPQNWVVDFAGVARGFLSHRAPEIFGRENEKIKEYCGVVRNFLNYVSLHGVCPEYNDDLIAAKMICNLAEKELPAVSRVAVSMPGDFNMAASTLFQGYYARLHGNDSTWYHLDESDATKRRQILGMTVAEAERIFKTAIAFCGTYEMFKAMQTIPIVIRKGLKSMEVIGITIPTPDKQYQFSGVKDIEGKAGNIKPLGILTVKDWDNPQVEEDDTTEEEGVAAILARKTRCFDEVVGLQEFWLEEEILSICFIGMKFEAIVHELSIGVKFFDSIHGIFPSFYTFLPSERLEKWKEPVPNPRPAPGADNPDVGWEVEQIDNFYD